MKSITLPPPSRSWPPLAPSRRAGDRAPVNEEQLAAVLKFHWFFVKSVLKENYLSLTDDDLSFTQGRELEFLEHLERKTGRDREEFSQLILQCGAVQLR